MAILLAIPISQEDELAYVFAEPVNYIAGLFDHYVFNLQKRFSFKKDTEANFIRKSSPLTITLGLGISGNELDGVAFSMPKFKFFPTLGFEYLASSINTSFYARRAVWLFPEKTKTLSLNFSSQLNYLGASYHYKLPKQLGTAKLGTHWFWNATRGQQSWDNITNDTITEENLWFNYQNYGMGLDLRYSPANSNFDFVFNMDVYFEANPRVGTGLNRESFRFSVLYNL